MPRKWPRDFVSRRCVPVSYLSAQRSAAEAGLGPVPKDEKTPLTQGLFSTRLLWAMVDSNHRPPPYQRGALTD